MLPRQNSLPSSKGALLGSSLKVIPVSDTETRIEAGDILALSIRLDKKKKVIDF